MSNNNFQNTPNEKENKKHFSLSSLIYNDKYLIILSLFLAVLVWIGSSLSVGTDENRTIKANIPVSLSDKMSEQLGMEYFSLQNDIDLNVTINGAKYVVGQVTAEDLNITFDTSGINRTGEQSVPIQVSSKTKTLDFDVVSVSPSSLECYFDAKASKTFTIETRFDHDAVADGYVFGEPVLSEDKIVVTGPKTFVDGIRSAYIDVDFGNDVSLSEPFSQDCDIHFEGTNIDTNYFKISNKVSENDNFTKVSVSIPVFKEAVLPVTLTFDDKPAGLAGSAVSVSYSVNSLNVGVLKSADITTANIGTIDFNDLTVGTQQFEFKTDEISGVSVLDDVDTVVATVRVSSAYTVKNVSVSKSKVLIEGAKNGDNLQVQSLDNNTISVVVPLGTEVKASDLVMKCDVSKKADDNVYPIEISVSNDKCWVYGKYNAVVK